MREGAPGTPKSELANSTNLRKTSAGRVPAILGFGALFSVVLTTFEYTGGTLRGGRGNNRTVELEEYDRKEEHRLNRRRPIEEAVLNLGEGRGTWLSFFPLLLSTRPSVYYAGWLADRQKG